LAFIRGELAGQPLNLESQSGTKTRIPPCPNLQHQSLPAAKLGQLSDSPPILTSHRNEKRYRNGKLLVNFSKGSFTDRVGAVDALGQIQSRRLTTVLNLARSRTSRVGTARVTRFRKACPGTAHNLHNFPEIVAPICGQLHPIALRFLKTCKNRRLLVTHRTEAEAFLNFDTPNYRNNENTRGNTRKHG
jgi:hypothetical protein